MNKLIRKVSLGLSKNHPMSMSQVLELISVCYSKKKQDMAMNKVKVDAFEDFCHKVFTHRFGFLNKVKQNEEEFLLGVLSNFKKDQ
jgi:hypothetical protein